MEKYDYILIGHGLAGACLSEHLIRGGRKVLVIDRPDRNISSSRAAGLYNPVTGRKMVKTWKADTLFPYLEKFYRAIEQKTGREFLHEINIVRPFISTEEYNDWTGKSASPEFRNFIEKINPPNKNQNQHLVSRHGSLELKHSGFLDINEFLEGHRELLKGLNAYQETEIEHDHINLDGNRVVVKDFEASRLVFCDGTRVTGNKFFNWLPMQPVRGEVLELELEETLPRIYNRGVFILPFRQNIHKVGSTYDHNLIDPIPTPEGRKQILEKLNQLINVKYAVAGHYAGVRPATVDRRPIIGIHPKYKKVGIFNGLGTKGVSLAPYFAKEFAEYLENGKELASEVHINRFLHKFIN